MPSLHSDHHDRLVRGLQTIAQLDENEKTALRALPFRLRDISENRDIVRQGDRPTECCLILDGLASRYKLVMNGRRQILSLHFAGDMPDLQGLHLDVMDHGISALTTTRIGLVSHDAIRAMTRQMPRLGDLLTRHALIDASIFREWIANVGRRPARARVAHVFCEVFVRMRALGLANQESFKLPMTQAELGDATGLSPVHMNRTLQHLRHEKLICSHGDVHTVIDWAGLRETADFDTTYLHLAKSAS
jgi:CRP-like cAMP-binding protein